MDNLEIKNMTIQELTKEKLRAGFTPEELGQSWGVSYAMISRYKTGYSNPSLQVAIIIYKLTKEVIYPFSKEAVQNERHA